MDRVSIREPCVVVELARTTVSASVVVSKTGCDLPLERRLILFDHHQVIAASVENRFRGRHLRVHRVGGDNQAGQRQLCEQIIHLPDFIGPIGDGDLR